MRRRTGSGCRYPQARRVRLVRHDRALGEERADRVRDRLAGELAGRPVRPLRRLERGIGAADHVGEVLERADRVVGPGRQHVHVAAVRHEVAGLLGVGEERHRRLGVDEHQVAQSVELCRHELGEITEPLERWAPGAALQAGGERLAEQLGAGGVGDATRGHEARLARHAATDEQRGRFTRHEYLGHGVDDVVGDSNSPRRQGRLHRLGALAPRHVGGQDQRRHLAGRSQRGGHGFGGVAGDVGRPA